MVLRPMLGMTVGSKVVLGFAMFYLTLGCVKRILSLLLADDYSNWNWNIIMDNIPGNVAQQISDIVPPHRNSRHKDCCGWSITANVLFSIASSYELHSPSNNVAQDRQWNRVWKPVVPERVKYHAWMLLVKGLKTSLFLFQRKLRDPYCGTCNGIVKSLLHMFCDCWVSKILWLSLISTSQHSFLLPRA